MLCNNKRRQQEKVSKGLEPLVSSQQTNLGYRNSFELPFCLSSSALLSNCSNLDNKMEKKVHLVSNCRYQSILSSRGVPFLFIIVCFLIIANTRCDQVGSTNEDDSTSSLHQEKTTTQTKTTTYDPLNMLREIYLDHNSKVITMILPSNGDTVQKFHPNGRYGRRSVNNLVEPHAELGKLKINDDSGTLRSMILRGLETSGAGVAASNSASSTFASNLFNNNQNKNRIKTVNPEMSKMFDETRTSGNNKIVDENELTNDQMELSKLLKCNYSGISNLYWCDNGLIN